MKNKARQKRMGDIGVTSLNVRNEASLKSKKARSGALIRIIFWSQTCCSARFLGHSRGRGMKFSLAHVYVVVIGCSENNIYESDKMEEEVI